MVPWVQYISLVLCALYKESTYDYIHNESIDNLLSYFRAKKSILPNAEKQMSGKLKLKVGIHF